MINDNDRFGKKNDTFTKYNNRVPRDSGERMNIRG